MNLTLTRPAATLSHRTLATPEASPRRVGEGLGARVDFRIPHFKVSLLMSVATGGSMHALPFGP